MLHELARQVKGEIAREAADELAMARDLADELARREAELAERNEGQSPAGSPGDQDGQGRPRAARARMGKTARARAKAPSLARVVGRVAGLAWDALTEAEQIERMAEMARTLEAWLKQIDKRGEGQGRRRRRRDPRPGERRRDRRASRADGRAPPRRQEARNSARRRGNWPPSSKSSARPSRLLHRGIVAPQLAALVEFDRRVAELTAKLATLKTEAEVAAWKREVAALIRDLEKAGVEGAAELADALRAGGGWHWDGTHNHLVAPVTVSDTLKTVSIQIKDGSRT